MNLPETKIEQLTVAPKRRVLVTSDVHGHLGHLEKVLEMAGFCRSDLLVIVGDLLEKGPHSLGVLRKVMALCESGNAVCVIGNVDAYRLHIIQGLCEETAEELWQYVAACRGWYGTSFYEELAVGCGHVLNCKEDVLQAKGDILDHFREELDFLASLPTVLETDNYVFVHGGLKKQAVADNALCGVFELTKYDAFADRTPFVFDKWVVVGHWPVALYGERIQQYKPVKNYEKRILSIDGGCGIKEEGQLNLLILPHIGCSVEEITHLSYDDLPKVKALETQEGDEDSLFISWITRHVEVLEKGEEFTYVRHLHSGRELWVPNVYFYKETECLDYSDHLLPVEAGEVLSLSRRTSKGCIVKKNGVVGWYCGAVEELPS